MIRYGQRAGHTLKYFTKWFDFISLNYFFSSSFLLHLLIFYFLSYPPSFSPSSFFHQHRSSSFWLWHSVRPAGGSRALLTVWWMTSLRRGLWVGNMEMYEINIYTWSWERRKQMEEEDGEKVVTDAPLKTEKLHLFRTVLLHQIKAELPDYRSDHLSVFLWGKKVSLNVLLLLSVSTKRPESTNTQWKVRSRRCASRIFAFILSHWA